MYNCENKGGYHTRVKGIDQKTLVFGERTLMAEFRLKKGAVVPRHSHPYEQTGYLVSGRMIFISGEERFEALPGDSWCILMNVEHSAEVLEDSVAVEVFSPIREDYLPGENL
ncbi:MAG: cupin domain-containing protein [Deltaproteobacteria bacterium HGW-Deltaproteobacteria-1]|jgi:quercetin dioxygenase-like cupin family protein|nr:MAG: cupin domain-containing protein [Deltaproteobacteria bacterium HGW-Deltaproteobacteria-1]